jgi:23S rRNA (cytosine1962-C5)-methyltransferase
LGRGGRSVRGPDGCRLIFGEADHLPGLIVDRFADLLVIQLLTAGMERVRETVLGVLRDSIQPRAVYERNDASPRKLEGLAFRKGFAWGEGETGLWIQEGDLRFFVEGALGQKTGFFLDQRDNRRVVQGLAAGRDILDCFCYSGVRPQRRGGGAASATGLICRPRRLPGPSSRPRRPVCPPDARSRRPTRSMRCEPWIARGAVSAC